MSDQRGIEKQIGRNIRSLRIVAGRSQADLGRHLGVTAQQMQKYESGRNRIAAATLVQLREYFDCTYDELFAQAGTSPLPSSESDRLPKRRLAMQLVRAFEGLDRNLQKRIADLVRCLGKQP